ncbi:MAG: carbon-nitrogen hydrolase family protein [Deltaproteobacteria bacterium]|jgi:predicted amidohydrolase|nr:carbon-nitrogen hydrolase family protein [Deltaproteobacteria bacterium]
MPEETILTAILHLAVSYKDPLKNQREILSHAQEAADNGAKIIIAPEMSLSGYIFDDRSEIAPYTQRIDDKIAKEFSSFAREREIYLIVGMAERAEDDMFYNSAFAYDPKGSLVCHYRKINSEARWACPGPAVQDNVFTTPWGKVGLLICADTYHSLPIRITALKGADLVLVPANWPPSSFFPENIWRMRALENGIFLIAVNRTGSDGQHFNCSTAESFVIDPLGNVLYRLQSEESKILYAHLPLDEGKLGQGARKRKIFESRKPEMYHRLYANLSFHRDLTSSFNMEPAAAIDLQLMAPGRETPTDFVLAQQSCLYNGNIVVLPLWPYKDYDIDTLREVAKAAGVRFFTAKEEEGLRTHIMVDKDGATFIPMEANKPPKSLDILKPLYIMPVRGRDLIHPELALCGAKMGLDALIAIEESIGATERFLVSMRPIEQLAVAYCAQNGAAVGLVPDGHSPGRGANCPEGTVLSYTIDTRDLRVKRFQDRVDFPVIFKTNEVSR